MANLELRFVARGGKSPPVADLSVRHFDIAEALSTPFEVSVVATSSDPDVDLDHAIGHEAQFTLDRGPLGRRTWVGVCSHAELMSAEESGLMTYAFHVVPKLWLLGQRRNHRVFRAKSAVTIAETLLGEWEIEAQLLVTRERHADREARVQYGETDLAFLSRILEEAGIAYYFAEESTKAGAVSRVVLADAPERRESSFTLPISTRSELGIDPRLVDVRLAGGVRPGGAVVSSWDFKNPRYQPRYDVSSAGAGEAMLERHTFAPVLGDAHGNARAASQLASDRHDRRRIAYTANRVDLAPGTVFRVTGAPRPELTGERSFLAVATSLEGTEHGDWQVTGVAAFADEPVKPELRTPTPRMEGLQNALVVGPPGEVIHTDDFGRVRVRFPWDRDEQDLGIWVRVDAGWGGGGFGMVAIPRIGHEVLVGFYDGNPDDPVIIGRAYNAMAPAPAPLPNASRRSGWRTRLMAGGQHELAFDDRAGQELVTLRSDGRHERVVKRDELETTHGDRVIQVGGHVGTTVGTTDAIVAGQMHRVSMATVTDKGASALATKREVIAKRITITTGGSTIMLDGPDIVVTGQNGVRIQAGGTVSVQGSPYVQINPPVATASADTERKAETGHVVWFKLHAKGGEPIAGARVAVHAGDAVSHQVTDGNGLVRVPVSGPGTHDVKVAVGSTAAPAGIKVATTPAQVANTAKPTEHEVPVELEILEPKPDAIAYLLPAPAMPSVELHARVLVQGQPVASGSVRWELELDGRYRVRDAASTGGYRQQEYTLAAGFERTNPNEAKAFLLAPGEIAGGDLIVKATFEGGADLGGITVTKRAKGGRVLGKNLDPKEFEAAVVELAGARAWLYLRMFWWESTMRQFATKAGGGNTPGEPLYGPPSGVGLVQRDPTADEWKWPTNVLTQPNNFFPRIFWNWRKNLEEGIASFASDYVQRGRRDLDALRRHDPHLPVYSDGVLLRAAIRRYNGGTEYVASPDGKQYVVHPSSNNPGYVDDVLDNKNVDASKYPVPADARATKWP